MDRLPKHRSGRNLPAMRLPKIGSKASIAAYPNYQAPRQPRGRPPSSQLPEIEPALERLAVLVETALEGRRGLERFLRVWQESVTQAIQEGRRDTVLRQLWIVGNMAMDHEDSLRSERERVRPDSEVEAWGMLWSELLALLDTFRDRPAQAMAERIRQRLEASTRIGT
jgi:hypothetical protein